MGKKALEVKRTERTIRQTPLSDEERRRLLDVASYEGQVFEAMYGGSQMGRYHGYPIRRTDPFFDRIKELWVKVR